MGVCVGLSGYNHFFHHCGASPLSTANTSRFTAYEVVVIAVPTSRSIEVSLVLVQITPSNTPNNETVTINGVSMLLSGLSDVSCNVQVINVLEEFSPSGCRKYTITISDGVHCYDCAVLPKLFHLFIEKAVGTFTVVHIHQVSMTEINGLYKIVVLDMIHCYDCAV
jgi:hypothetical protein